MKRVQKKKKNIKRVLGFTALTMALVCVFVVGFFAIKTGSIFGFSYGTTYVDKDATPENIPDERLKVTGQEDYSSVLSPTSSEKYSGKNAMPEIPEANSKYEKGTKENPLVILEIVPELAQQSLSYFATSKEDGLPFDPLEMSMKMSKDKGKSFIPDDKKGQFMLNNKHIKSGSWKPQGLKSANLSWLTDVGGIFSSNNFDNLYQIYDYDHSVTDSSRKTNGHDYDFSNAPLVKVDAYYTVEMKKGSSFVQSLSSEENGDSYPTIASLYDGNADFKAAFVDKDNQDIPREVIDDDLNWAWSVERDSDSDMKFSISVTSPTEEFKSDYAALKSGTLGQKNFFERYNDLLSIADDGTAVTSNEFDKIEEWTFNDSQENGTLYKIDYNYEGYKLKFQYVGLKWNDVLKRMLVNFTDELDSDGNVIKTADEQYEDYHIKIIVVTPDMINEMDKNDTDTTLDYIERADMYYVSSYYSGKSGGCPDQVKNLINFYWNYIDTNKETALSSKEFSLGEKKNFTITVTDPSEDFKLDYSKLKSGNLSKVDFLTKYEDILSKTDDETVVSDEDFGRKSCWTFDDPQEKTEYTGYFVCVGDQKGDVNLDVYWTTYQGENKGRWKYVKEKSELPDGANDFWADDRPDYQVNFSTASENDYVSASLIRGFDDTIKSKMEFKKESNYIIRYSYDPDHSVLASFEENDLEWSDCMKIIKRLSGDAGLAMMFSKQMGFYLDDGTDNVCNLLYDSTYKHDKKGSLCNLAKLYLIATLFDLSATTTSETSNDLIWTFMDNVYANIQQVKLSDSAKSPDNTAQYTGYFKEVEEGVNAVCTSHDPDSMYTYLWNLYTFVPYVTSASEDSLYSSDGSADLNTFVNKYGFLSSSLLGTYPEKTYGHVDGNISDKGYNAGLASNNSFYYTSLTGTRDPLEDYQNVTIVMPGDMEIVTWQMGQDNLGVPGTFLYGTKGTYNAKENLDNKNFTIIDKGVMSRIAVVLFNIMQNAKAPNPTMKFNIDTNQQSKKYYQKMSNSNVLIDYNQTASYNEQRSKEKNVLKLFCTLNNSTNRENSIITSIKLVDPNDSSKPAIPIDTIYNTDGDVIEKEENIGFSETLPTPKKYSVEYITGYKVTSNNAKYSFVVPFKLSDWQNGYTQMRIDWVARSSKKVKGEYTPYQNPSNPNDKDLVEAARQFAEVDIGERELFDLE